MTKIEEKALKVYLKGKEIGRKVVRDENGEGAAFVAGMMAVGVAICVVLWGLISGWLPTFWNNLTSKINSIG